MRIQDILSQCDFTARYSLPDIKPETSFTLLNRRTKNYLHFSLVDCINNSQSNIELSFQSNDTVLIPAKTIISLQDKTISLLEIRNLSPDNTIRSDEISLTFHRWIR